MREIYCLCPKCGHGFEWEKPKPVSLRCCRCSGEFVVRHPFQVYCSKRCRVGAAKKRKGGRLTEEQRNKKRLKARNRRISNLQKNPLLREKERLNASLYWMKSKTENPVYRIRNYLRARIRRKLKSSIKSFDCLLGCSPQELKAHLQLKFKKGMSWDNYGTYWVVDHIQPLRLFDLLKEDQIRAACHFTNLQPLTEEENQIKAGSITEPQMTMPV